MAKSDNQPGPGHNSGVAGDELRSFLERVERVQEEIDGLRGDQKEIFAEAKGRGYDVKAMRRLLALRKQDASDRKEQMAILELYASAIGMEDVFA